MSLCCAGLRSGLTLVCVGALGFGCGQSSEGTQLSGATTPTAESGDTTATSAEETGTADAESGGFKYDVGGDDGPLGNCDGDGEVEFSYIWVANSAENTVSKINTFNLVEEARYQVHSAPDTTAGLGSPSRTSVNLNGDMVVANRCDIKGTPPPGCAGVTMIVAREADCVDANNDDVITTSTGPGDVKPWGEDECVIWHRPFDDSSNRPVAWTSGEESPDGCHYDDPQVWTATADSQNPGGALVYLLDEADGNIAQTVSMPAFGGDTLSVYGGAVDSHNDFWFVGGYGRVLGHVRIEDFTHETFAIPNDPYGIIVDSEDRPWVAGFDVKRYTPETDTWDSLACMQNGCSTIVQGPDGWVWVTEGARIYKIDPDTVSVVDTIETSDIPELSGLKGVSVDFEGYLWVLEQGTRAFKIDRNTYAAEIFQNQSSMYTYSDMTGFGLKNVNNPAG